MAYYLLFLLLISLNFFHVIGIGTFFSDDVALVFLVIFMIYGYKKYKKISFKKAYSSSENRFGRYYLYGVLLSFIPAFLYSHQGFLQSFQTNRWIIPIITLAILVSIKPTVADFKKTIHIYSIIYFIVISVDAVTNSFVVRQDNVLWEGVDVNTIEEGDFVHFTPGFTIIALGLFITLQDLSIHYSPRALIKATFYIFIIFLVQNRGTLFPCALIYLYVLLTIKDPKAKKTARFVSCCVIALTLFLALPSFLRLFEETKNQVGDSDYNRILALAYYPTKGVHGFLSYFFGNGILSAHVAWDDMLDLRDLGVFTSDIGMVGLWSEIGILPVYSILLLCFNGIKKKNPTYIKFMSLLLLSGVVTQAFFVGISRMVELSFYFYYANAQNLNINVFKTRKKMRGKHRVSRVSVNETNVPVDETTSIDIS